MIIDLSTMYSDIICISGLQILMSVVVVMEDVTRAATTQMAHLCAPVKMVMIYLMMKGLVLILMSAQLDHMVVNRPVLTRKDNTDAVVMLAMLSTMTKEPALVNNLSNNIIAILKVHCNIFSRRK